MLHLCPLKSEHWLVESQWLRPVPSHLESPSGQGLSLEMGRLLRAALCCVGSWWLQAGYSLLSWALRFQGAENLPLFLHRVMCCCFLQASGASLWWGSCGRCQLSPHKAGITQTASPFSGKRFGFPCTALNNHESSQPYSLAVQTGFSTVQKW